LEGGEGSANAAGLQAGDCGLAGGHAFDELALCECGGFSGSADLFSDSCCESSGSVGVVVYGTFFRGELREACVANVGPFGSCHVNPLRQCVVLRCSGSLRPEQEPVINDQHGLLDAKIGVELRYLVERFDESAGLFPFFEGFCGFVA
jgi:hypothetical protein